MKVTRNLIREYYGIPEGEAHAYHYVNAGFVKCNEENNAKVDKTTFVGDVNAACTITGYENGWKYEAQYVKGDPVVDDLAAIAREQRIGDGCERMLVSVDMTDPVAGESGVYRARRALVAVECSPPAGEPKNVLKLEGVLHQNGDLALGSFNVLTRAFIPA
ncbi:MAG: hypothetical protein VB087_04530 [Candidatus Limiplasma sp.]|nr:hypothetical protein [Candidatus Limiplasma sp.]MEA5145754.1 hypothetical protein [Candidatus Limiplasma sp.]